MSKVVKYNKSKTYLLPLLSELVPLRVEFVKFLENTYIFDDIGKYENCIAVLHEFTFKDPTFTRYENQLVASESFVELVDIGNQVLYIFKFPEEYLTEYNHFKDGKYSKFGLDAKEIILNFWGDVYRDNMGSITFLLTLKQVLFRDKKLKNKLEQELSSRTHKVVLDDDAELTSIMEETDETFELSKYQEHENKI